MVTMSGHPPRSHNPHVYAELNSAYADAGPVSLEDTGPAPEDVVQVGAEDAAVDEDAPADLDGDGEISGYEAMLKADLVAEAERRGLPVSGTKPELIARLEEHDAGQPEASGE